MKYYELTYLTSPGLAEEERKNLSERVIAFLPNPPTKKEDGFSSTTLDFYAHPEKIQEIEKALKTEEQVKRFMLLVKKLTKPKLRASRRRLAEDTTIQPAEAEKTEKKVELKEIEKKLDEILKNEPQ